MKDKLLSSLKNSGILSTGLLFGYLATATTKVNKLETIITNKTFEFVVPQITLPATVTNIHDLDTVTVEVTQRFNVRMLDNWAIELSNENGKKARDLLIEKCPIGSEVIVQIPFKQDLSKMLTLGRVLGKVYKDGEDLSEFAVSTGFSTKEKIK